LLTLAYLGTLFDGTIISGRLIDGSIIAECVGLAYTLVEIVEILAWIGTVMRESMTYDKISYTVPTLEVLENPGKSTERTRFRLQFAEESLSADDLQLTTGNCWQTIMKNPGIAIGLPTAGRPDSVPGLEVPLGVMGALVDAHSLAVFDQVAIAKGFNAAVALTGQTYPFLLWHAVVNEDGSRLSYCDSRLRRGNVASRPTDIIHMQTASHVLGWTPRICYNIGMLIPSAELSVKCWTLYGQ